MASTEISSQATFEKRDLSVYEAGLLFGGAGLSGTAFVLVTSRALAEPQPPHFFVFYTTTFCLFLLFLLRYQIITRIYNTERTYLAWVASILIALLGPLTVWATTMGSTWFLSYASLLFLAVIKNQQSSKRVGLNPKLNSVVRAYLREDLTHLSAYELLVAMAMLAFWFATGTSTGLTLSVEFFGIGDQIRWRNAMQVTGGSVALIFTALLAFRIANRHRHEL